MIDNCIICGKSLQQPITESSTFCNRCKERNYWERLKKRFKRQLSLTTLHRFETYNCPCYCCTHFKFSNKETLDMFNTFLCCHNGLEERFIFPDVGGYCNKLKCMVDGNIILLSKKCSNKHYRLKKSKKPKPIKLIQTELKL